jgi:hypothetical protein
MSIISKYGFSQMRIPISSIRSAAKAWGYGSTLDPPGKIDFSIELHQTPTDIFSDAPTPVLASFVFQRDVPKSEKQPPATLAKKQCAEMKN